MSSYSPVPVQVICMTEKASLCGMVVEGWLHRAAHTHPGSTALESPDGSRSYAALYAAACTGARALLARGVTPGERVAIALAPGLAFAEALHACLLLGAVAVPVDVRLAPAERALVCGGAAPLVSEASPIGDGDTSAGSHGQTVADGGRAVGSGMVADGRTGGHGTTGVDAIWAGGHHDLDAVAAVIHTSGTTSAPRPVELTYGNFLWSALGSAAALDRDPDERWLCA